MILYFLTVLCFFVFGFLFLWDKRDNNITNWATMITITLLWFPILVLFTGIAIWAGVEGK